MPANLERTRSNQKRNLAPFLKRQLRKAFAYPAWLRFRTGSKGKLVKQPETNYPGQGKEELIERIIEENRGSSFLEIGIGNSANIPRLKRMLEQHISYKGCDFDFVCEKHSRELRSHRMDLTHIKYATNTFGDYNWTLLRLLQAGEKFDIIYLDGHHTFAIDCPAAMLAHFLLKPNGLLLLDDIQWTLNLLRWNMHHNFSEWFFYRSMYNLSGYSKEQLDTPHIELIATEVLIRQFNYKKVEELCIPTWWTLRKREAP
jgi:hypothetical protein